MAWGSIWICSPSSRVSQILGEVGLLSQKKASIQVSSTGELQVEKSMFREAYMNKWRIWVARVGSVIRKSAVLCLEIRLAREVEHNGGEDDVHRPSKERHADDDPEDGHGPERDLPLVASNGDEHDELADDESHNGGQEDDEERCHHLALDEVGALLQSCEAVILWFQNGYYLGEHEEQAKDEQADRLGEGVEEEEDDGTLGVDERCEQSKGNGDG